MKKNLFLFLLLLVCAGRASADGIGANCGNATPLRTNGQFQAIACDVLGLGTAILIDGPAGLETFVVGSDFVDGFLSFYLNARGEVVASWQATGTDATFVLAYTGPDVQNRGAMTLGCDMCGPDVLPGTTIRTNFAYLRLTLGPVFNNTSPPDEPIYDQISTYILATGITDHGIVEANVPVWMPLRRSDDVG